MSTPPMSRLRSWLPVARRLWRALSEVVSALKAAIGAVQVNSAILLSLLGKVVWILPLLICPTLFDTNPTFYKAFAAQWSESVWTGIVAAFIALDLLALVLRRFSLDLFVLGVGVFLCAFLASLASTGAPHGRLGLPAAPFCYIYGFGGVGCFLGALRRIADWSAEQEAAGYRVLQQEVNRQLTREILAGRI